MQKQQTNDSLIDATLKAIKFESAINTHAKFIRSDEQPKDVVLRIKKVIGPKRNPHHCSPRFPFEDNVFSLEKKELQKWAVDRAEKMLQYLNEELNKFDDIVQANAIAALNASNFDQRKHFYYLALLSILDLPQDIAFKKLDTLIAYKKLLLNRYLIDKNIEMSIPEKSCTIRGCPHLAIHGSEYCAWHILNDPRQQLFDRCEICGWPRLGPCQCTGHQSPE